MQPQRGLGPGMPRRTPAELCPPWDLGAPVALPHLPCSPPPGCRRMRRRCRLLPCPASAWCGMRCTRRCRPACSGALCGGCRLLHLGPWLPCSAAHALACLPWAQSKQCFAAVGPARLQQPSSPAPPPLPCREAAAAGCTVVTGETMFVGQVRACCWVAVLRLLLQVPVQSRHPALFNAQRVTLSPNMHPVSHPTACRPPTSSSCSLARTLPWS